jgi:hypothetical protein
LAQGEAWLPVAVGRHLPGGQIVVDIFIQIKNALFNQPHDRQGKDRLADRTGLKERFRCDWRRLTGLTEAKALRPFDFVVVDHRNTDAGGLTVGHPFGQGGWYAKLVFQMGGWQQIVGNAFDAFFRYAHRFVLSLASCQRPGVRPKFGANTPFLGRTCVLFFVFTFTMSRGTIGITSDSWYKF